jgi:hypothetical protein
MSTMSELHRRFIVETDRDEQQQEMTEQDLTTLSEEWDQFEDDF